MITSTKNPRIVNARKLMQRKHRRQQDRFLVEGLQLLGMAVEMMAQSSRVQPREVFYCESLFSGNTAPRLLADLTRAGAEAIPVAENVLNTLSERDTSQGITATFSLSALEWPLPALLAALGGAPAARRLVLLLDRLQDPGNLGTLIRTADAVGAAAVILLEPCVDPFDPKTVRGSMGSLLTVPFSRAAAPGAVLPQLAALGFKLVGADASQGSTAWRGDALSGAAALVLGNEARGLSADVQPWLSHFVSLPLRGHAESLNVSVAGGVLLYEWLRVNQADLPG